MLRNSDHACDLPVHESVLIPTTHGREKCKIKAADPTVSIEWSELQGGHWRAVCHCGSEDVYEEPADRRVRLDPYDPSIFRHAGQCEHRYTSDPALLRPS